MSPMVEARELRILFPTQDGLATVKAVDGVNLQVMAGETFGVIGESGSGKTTLGRALVSLIKPSAGQVLHGGVDLAKVSSAELRLRRREHQIVFQDPNASLNPRLSILDSVIEPLQIAGSGSAESRQAAALAALSRVGLAREYASRFPHQLSGGQKQRVNIARVLTLRPKLIVCDEVVAALDIRGGGARHGVPILAREAVADLRFDRLLVAVGSRGARDEIRAMIAELRPDLVEGAQWWALA
jgi:peptide/nickel transport system ATP-binding protein/oligopeptide transport system ATP-binding protein